MVNETVETADTFLKRKLEVHQQPVRYPEQCVSVSRPKHTVKNVWKALVVHVLAEHTQSQTIVLI